MFWKKKVESPPQETSNEIKTIYADGFNPGQNNDTYNNTNQYDNSSNNNTQNYNQGGYQGNQAPYGQPDQGYSNPGEPKIIWANQQGTDGHQPVPDNTGQNNQNFNSNQEIQKKGFFARQFEKLNFGKGDVKSTATDLFNKYSETDGNTVSSDDLPSIITEFLAIAGINTGISATQISWAMKLLNIKAGDNIDYKSLKRVLKLVSGAKSYLT